jgi:hypothetical protein
MKVFCDTCLFIGKLCLNATCPDVNGLTGSRFGKNGGSDRHLQIESGCLLTK